MLWSDMKYTKFGCEEISLFSQKKPHEPMSFERKTIGAECICACNASVRKKFAIRMIANRAFDRRSTIQLGKDFHDQWTDSLQKTSWNVPDYKTYGRFHLERLRDRVFVIFS
jgi:hypothetical protein